MARASRVVCFGECMIELQGQAFGAMQQTFGGDTLNTAVYLARYGWRHGIQVDYATALGDDSLSAGMLSRWQAEGVGTSLVRRLPGRMPGLYLIEVDERGERRFNYWREHSAARSYFDTAVGDTPLEQHIDSIDSLYISGISLAILPTAGRDRLAAVARALRERGAMVAFDNNYRPRLWPDLQTAQHSFQTFLELASVGLVTLDDDMALWGESNAQSQLPRSLAWPCAELVIKRGALPTLVRVAGQAVQEAATVPVAQVVDTTAAGDSFAGAYLAQRMGGATPLEAAAAGNRLAALVVQHHGAVIGRQWMPAQ